jgi:hypothetical protein
VFRHEVFTPYVKTAAGTAATVIELLSGCYQTLIKSILHQ